MAKERGDVRVTAGKSKSGAIIGSFLFAAILWLSVVLADRYYVTLNLPLKIINIPAGWSPSNKLPSRVSVKMKTTGWRALYLYSQHLIFVASFPGENNNTSVISFRASIAENSWNSSETEIVEIIPSQVVTGLEKTVSRYKKIRSALILEFKEGEGLAGPILFSPDSVLVSGSREAVKQIQFIETEKSRLTLSSGQSSETVNLIADNGIELKPVAVQAMFDVQKIVETAVPNVRVRGTEIPSGWDMVTIPPQATVGIKGGIDYVGRIKPEDITLSIRFSDAIQDTAHFIAPEILLPKNVEKVYLEPEKIKIIIKKF